MHGQAPQPRLAPPLRSTSGLTAIRLAAFVFMQYFALGIWFVALGTYMSKGLHFDGVIGLAYASQGLAAIISTMVIGVVADRFLPKRVALAGLMAISGLSLLALARISGDQSLFLAMVLLHFLAFVPTIPLSNAVCLEALADPERQFARIRVFGTIGWVVGGVVVGAIPHAAISNLPIHLGALTMLGLGAVSLLLPQGAPPPRDAQKLTLSGALGLDVLARIRDRSFWSVIVCTALISAPLAFYNAYCNNFLQETGAVLALGTYRFEPTAIQALGQLSEIGFLLMLPPVLRRIDIGGVLLLGMAGWIARAACFIMAAHVPSGQNTLPFILPGILLHGMCYDFMLVGAALFVDRVVGGEARARAQSFLTFVTMGVGVMLGSLLANAVYGLATVSDSHHDWSLLWTIVGALATLAMVTFLASFQGWRRQAAQP